MPLKVIAVVLGAAIGLAPTLADAAKPFADKAFAVQDYAGQRQMSSGVMQTWSKGEIELYYDWHQNGGLAGRKLTGRFRVTGKTFCYLFPMLGMTSERCGRFDGKYLTFPGGYRTWYQAMPASTAKAAIRGKFTRYAGDFAKKPVSKQRPVQTPERRTCKHPMTDYQKRRVTQAITDMLPRHGKLATGKFTVDKCRYISVTYARKTVTGPLHQLGTELNYSHHDTVYLGLIPAGEWGVKQNLYVTQDNPEKQSIAQIIKWNEQILEMLKLAGYRADPMQKRRADIIRRDMKNIRNPDFSDNLNNLLVLMKRYGGSSAQPASPTNSKPVTVPANARTKKFHCTVTCPNPGGAAGSLDYRSIPGHTAADAEKNLKDTGLTQICRRAGFSGHEHVIGTGHSVHCRP